MLIATIILIAIALVAVMAQIENVNGTQYILKDGLAYRIAGDAAPKRNASNTEGTNPSKASRTRAQAAKAWMDEIVNIPNYHALTPIERTQFMHVMHRYVNSISWNAQAKVCPKADGGMGMNGASLNHIGNQCLKVMGLVTVTGNASHGDGGINARDRDVALEGIHATTGWPQGVAVPKAPAPNVPDPKDANANASDDYSDAHADAEASEPMTGPVTYPIHRVGFTGGGRGKYFTPRKGPTHVVLLEGNWPEDVIMTIAPK
jgi:hypothetical protein